MRKVLAGVMLLAFGCGPMRYSARTEMVEVTTAPVAPPAPPSVAHPRRSHRQALLIGGTIASLVGVGFLVGGGVGYKRQEAANAEQDAQCRAAQGWFCGTFDDFSYLPYDALLGLGGVAVLGGIVMFGLAANGADRETR
jgi:hypothetical protein